MDNLSTPCLQPLYNAQSNPTPSYHALEPPDYNNHEINNGGYFVAREPAAHSAPVSQAPVFQDFQQQQPPFVTTILSPVSSTHSNSGTQQQPLQDFTAQYLTQPSATPHNHVSYSPTQTIDSRMINNGFQQPQTMVGGHGTQSFISPQQQQPVHTLHLPHSTQPTVNNFSNYSNVHPSVPQMSYGTLQENGNAHAKRTFEANEADSATTRESSHINRKKRKACGRCGPCQRKDNCGTCMNCVNRAKGKQICIFRKCEELKKKPGTEIYSTPNPNEHRPEKRKEIGSLLPHSEKKRAKGKDLKQQQTTLLASPQYSAYPSDNFSPRVQQQNDYQQHFPQNTSTLNNIIQDSYTESDPLLKSNLQQFHSPTWPSSASSTETTDFTQLNPSQNDQNFLSHDSNNLPDQLLNNLRRYNGPNSFHRSQLSPKTTTNTSFNQTTASATTSISSTTQIESSFSGEFSSESNQGLGESLLSQLDTTYTSMLSSNTSHPTTPISSSESNPLLFRYPQTTYGQATSTSPNKPQFNPSYTPPTTINETNLQYDSPQPTQHWNPNSQSQFSNVGSTNLKVGERSLPEPNLPYNNGLMGGMQSPVSSLVPGSPLMSNHGSISPCINNMPQLAPSPNTVSQDSNIGYPDTVKAMPQQSAPLNRFPQQTANEHFLDNPGSSAQLKLSTPHQGNLMVSGDPPYDTSLAARENLVSEIKFNPLNYNQSTSVSSQSSDTKTMSPNKEVTNSISPGESGYDSAEMSVSNEDSLSRFHKQNNDFTHSSVPKNLHAASVDKVSIMTPTGAEMTFKEAGGQANPSNIGDQPKSLKIQEVHKLFESHVQEKQNQEFSTQRNEVKAPVRLRRYSNPKSEFSEPSPVTSAVASSNHHEVINEIPKPKIPDEIRVEPKEIMKNKPNPLETPPMTPNSNLQRKFSADFCGASQIHNQMNYPQNHSINHIMATPPYSGDNTIKKEQKFFWDTANVPRPEPKEPTFDELRGIGKKVTVETAGKKNEKTVYVFPECNCIPGSSSSDEEPPYYTHLGAAQNVAGIRKIFETRTGFTGPELRIEKVIYTGKEGKTSRGCPIAKWIIRRTNEAEKACIICRHRPGHHCATAYITVLVMLWDGIARPLADYAYNHYVDIIPKNCEPTERKCGTNESKTCACQGFNDEVGGASFSFGCSWSMYYNGCKFARSTQPKKFKLTACKDEELEKFIDVLSSKLATVVSPLYKMATPHAHANQVEHEEEGYECRLGYNNRETGRPFCGFTTCFDFCAHAHKDQHNMDNGSTVVVTLTKPELRPLNHKPSDEQLHVLPLYKLDLSNEQGTFDGVSQKIFNGSIEILNGFRREVRLRDEPYINKKQRQKLARKKRVSTMEDINSPRKRRGRPPKRSLSVEDLTAVGKEPIQPMQMQFPPNVQRSITMHGMPPFNMQSPQTPAAATRWPYKRPSDGAYHPYPSPVSTPVYYSPMAPNLPQPQQSENLPSIGSFLGKKPTLNNNEKPSSTLPSLDTIMSHPFHQNFSVVQNNNNTTPKQQQTMLNVPLTPQSIESSPEALAKIQLKSYAMNQSPMLNFNTPPDPKPCAVVKSEVYSDSEDNFHDSSIGGVAIAPTHGSVIIECAKRELHATTPMLRPNRFNPSRISLVFYQHKSMNYRNHGAAQYEAREEKRQQIRDEKREKQELEKKLAAEQEAINRARQQQRPPMLPTIDSIARGDFMKQIPHGYQPKQVPSSFYDHQTVPSSNYYNAHINQQQSQLHNTDFQAAMNHQQQQLFHQQRHYPLPQLPTSNHNTLQQATQSLKSPETNYPLLHSAIKSSLSPHSMRLPTPHLPSHSPALPHKLPTTPPRAEIPHTPPNHMTASQQRVPAQSNMDSFLMQSKNNLSRNSHFHYTQNLLQHGGHNSPQYGANGSPSPRISSPATNQPHQTFGHSNNLPPKSPMGYGSGTKPNYPYPQNPNLHSQIRNSNQIMNGKASVMNYSHTSAEMMNPAMRGMSYPNGMPTYNNKVINNQQMQHGMYQTYSQAFQASIDANNNKATMPRYHQPPSYGHYISGSQMRNDAVPRHPQPVPNRPHNNM